MEIRIVGLDHGVIAQGYKINGQWVQGIGNENSSLRVKFHTFITFIDITKNNTTGLIG